MFDDNAIRKLFSRKKKTSKKIFTPTDPKNILNTMEWAYLPPSRQSLDLYNGINGIKHMIKKVAIWEDLGMSRPNTIQGVDRVLVNLESKLNEIIEVLNKQ